MPDSKPLTYLGAKPGEYFIARMKGYPPWPSIICDEDLLPDSLLESRPVTAQLPDASFKKPEYADGGKRAYERYLSYYVSVSAQFKGTRGLY